MHYANTVGLPGDISAVIARLLERVARSNAVDPAAKAAWLDACARQEAGMARLQARALRGRPDARRGVGQAGAGQPAAIKIAADFAKSIGAAKYFDAGDVQANGFHARQPIHQANGPARCAVPRPSGPLCRESALCELRLFRPSPTRQRGSKQTLLALRAWKRGHLMPTDSSDRLAISWPYRQEAGPQPDVRPGPRLLKHVADELAAQRIELRRPACG